MANTRITHAYHVTNIMFDERQQLQPFQPPQSFQPPQQLQQLQPPQLIQPFQPPQQLQSIHRPNWPHLELHPASNYRYDNTLLGRQCVFFSTTLFNEDFPDKSVYPTTGIPGKRYWRVKIPMSYFDNHQIYYVNRQSGQVHLELLGPNDKYIVNVPATAAEAAAGEVAAANAMATAAAEAQKYLRRENGIYFSNNYNVKSASEFKYFVNFAVLHEVMLPPNVVEWGTVEHYKYTHY